MIRILRRIWSALVRGDRAIDRLIRDYSREHLPVVALMGLGGNTMAFRPGTCRIGLLPNWGAYADPEQVVELRRRAA